MIFVAAIPISDFELIMTHPRAPALYDSLGVGWGNTLLALVTVGLAIPSPVLLWFYGSKLRARSPIAAGKES